MAWPFLNLHRKVRLDFGIVLLLMAAMGAAIVAALTLAVVTCKIPYNVHRNWGPDGVTTTWRYWDGRTIVEREPKK